MFSPYNYYNTAHNEAVLKGVLHRDISINNVMIYTPDESMERKGFLIDFDHAKIDFDHAEIDHPGGHADNGAIERTVRSFFVPI
jgi:Fungal protein kinase